MGDLVIGIDLGTTNSCAAYFRNDYVEILENSDGRRLTPSCVFFQKNSGSKQIVGQIAKKFMDTLPSNGIYEIKRFVGRNFNEIKEKLEYFSFNVMDSDGAPVVEIEQDSGILTTTPEEVSALILKKIKSDVEMKFGHPITKAVITVPAYFNSAQREATLAAATQAGFTVLKLFNEPTAAALSYYFKIDEQDECYSLVYDFGGGTFDVSVLRQRCGGIEIICVDGDTNLGGRDVDNLIIDYVCEELKRLHDYNPKKDRRNMRRLQNKCEEAKIELSTIEETQIILEGFISDPERLMIAIPFTRRQFEARAHDLFKKTVEVVERCFKDSNISKNLIKDVILSGGSSRIPKIKEMLAEVFQGAKITRFVNLDECVAEGAALQAALLSYHPNQKIQSLRITDVTRLSIGMKDFVGRMKVIIPRNSAIPVSKSTTFATAVEKQTCCEINVYEGERLDVEKNIFMGTIFIEGLTPAPAGCCKLHITFIIDNDGILKVKASEHLNDNTKAIKVRYVPGLKNDFEVASVVTDAQKNKEEDLRFEKFANKKEYFLTYCQRVLFNLETLYLKDTYNWIYDFCDELFYKGDAMTVADEQSLEKLVQKVREKCEALVRKYSFVHMPALPPSLEKVCRD